MAKVAAEALDPGHADTAVKPAIAMERTAETAKKPAAAATDDCFRMSRSPPRTGRERCAPAHRTFRSMFVLTPVTAPHSRQYRNALRARLYTLRSEDLVKTAFLFRPGWSAGSGHVSRSAEVRDTELLPGVDLRERTVRDRQAQRRGDRCPAVTRAPFEQPLRWRLGANRVVGHAANACRPGAGRQKRRAARVRLAAWRSATGRCTSACPPCRPRKAA